MYTNGISHLQQKLDVCRHDILFPREYYSSQILIIAVQRVILIVDSYLTGVLMWISWSMTLVWQVSTSMRKLVGHFSFSLFSAHRWPGRETEWGSNIHWGTQSATIIPVNISFLPPCQIGLFSIGMWYLSLKYEKFTKNSLTLLIFEI